MTYYISTSTDDSLESYIEEGMEQWNNVAMSDFEFSKGSPDTTEFLLKEDGINIINIDSQFCDDSHYGSESGSFGDLCNQGILGLSGTFTPEPGSNEPFQAKESDIVLNGVEFVWADGNPIGGTQTLDTAAVVAHEAGHSAGISHPGDECLASGSSGCGAEFAKATMYWNYNGGQPTDKGSLELDDIAALVYGYPKSTVRVRVLTDEVSPQPILGAKVDLLDSAAPVNGSSIAEGGSVYGDVTNAAVLVGNGSTSATYVNVSPFDDTNASGETNDITPTHENIRVRVTAGSLSPVVQSHTVVSGQNTVSVAIETTETDFAGPTVAVTSHTSGQSLGSADLTLTGTATDSGRGGNGISQVTVNGEAANNGTAAGNGVANWSIDVSLAEGANTLTIMAYDDLSGDPNSSTLTFILTYDTTAPTVSSVTPADGSAGIAVSTNFGVTFSEAIDPSTINTSTFLVESGVTGRVIYNASNNMALFVPSAPLAANTTYTATLTTGIQDLVGLPMAANFTWSITTGAPTSGSGGGSSGVCFIGAAVSY
jgi:hypothetical protein